MPNSKRTIYKPKKGRNVSQKKLYRLPSKYHGQRGGGFFDSLTSMLKGGEVPGAPAVDGDGNIVDVEDDKKEETPATEEEQTETPATEEEQTETPANDGEEKESEESTETPTDDGEEKGSEESPDDGEKEGEENKGILKGVGETMGRSLSDAASEVQGYMTQPAAENDSGADADYSDNDSVMESSNVNIQVPCDELLAENKQLREKIDQLQEEIKELLKNQLTKLESKGSDFSQNSTNEITPNMGENSDTYDISPMAPEKEEAEGFGESSEEGGDEDFSEAPTNTDVEAEGFSGASEEGGDEDFSEAPTNTGVDGEADGFGEPMAPEKESTNVEENVGGTKRHRNKHRKTKRKRNKHVSFHK